MCNAYNSIKSAWWGRDKEVTIKKNALAHTEGERERDRAGTSWGGGIR